MNSVFFLFKSLLFFILSFSLLLMPNCFVDLEFFNFFSLSLCLDFFSLMFLMMLFLMVFSVLMFALLYMREDWNSPLFLGILLSFVWSMVCLILVPDLVFMLLGWDGLGLTSFLLMIYYHSNVSWFSGFKTFLIKRLGDSLIMAFCMMLLYSGDFYLGYSFSFIESLVGLFLILGLFTKSAQYPFSSWLPAAMAAPTPVSALVHSSTLVTAGLFVLIRNFNYFFSFSWVFLICGFWTMLIASFVACLEWDLKKIMAYSTLSQLGLMSVILGLGDPLVSYFHLLSHACFKALLFILGGMLMLKISHFQDMRFLTGLQGASILFKVIYFSSLLSLSGLFFTSGLYSKDLMVNHLNLGVKFIYSCLLLFSFTLTVIYSFRLLSMPYFSAFFTSFNKKSFFYSLFSVVILWVLSLHLGYFYKNLFFSPSLSSSFYNSILLVLTLVWMGFVVLLNFFKNNYILSLFYLKFLKTALFTPFNKKVYLSKGLLKGGLFINSFNLIWSSLKMVSLRFFFMVGFLGKTYTSYWFISVFLMSVFLFFI